MDEVDDEQHRDSERVLSSGQLIKSTACSRNVDQENSSRTSKSRRRRRKKRGGRQRNDVNASTQTTPVDDDRRGTRQQVQDHPPAAASSRRRSVDEDSDQVDETEKIADMIRLLAAPILASEVKTALVHSKHPPISAGRPSLPARAADGRSNQSQYNHHHHHHHHHHRQQQQQQQHARQQADDGGPWRRTADIMARPPVVKITSYDEMSRAAAGRLPVAAAESRDLCHRCSRPRRPKDTAAGAGETR